MRFKTAFYGILAVIVVHILSIIFNFYGFWSSFDIPMHFAGGFVIGMLGIAIHHAVTDKHHFKNLPAWYHYLFVLGFVILIGVAWEFHEYLIDNTIGLWYGWLPTQPSIGDTMLDLLLDGAGALVAVRIFKEKL